MFFVYRYYNVRQYIILLMIAPSGAFYPLYIFKMFTYYIIIHIHTVYDIGISYTTTFRCSDEYDTS